MIRRFDKFYERRPRLCFALMISAAFVLMAIAKAWDKSDAAAMHMQWLATMSRGQT
jgi:hypothetical protein